MRFTIKTKEKNGPTYVSEELAQELQHVFLRAETIGNKMQLNADREKSK